MRVGIRVLSVLLPCLMLGEAAGANPVPALEKDGIASALTNEPGDAQRGRALVADRRKGLCLLCHSGPFPEVRFQGDLAPSLAGVGNRWSIPHLRARIVDSRLFSPNSVMPPYHSVERLERVAPAFSGKPIFSAQEVEDVVAFLATLKE